MHQILARKLRPSLRQVNPPRSEQQRWASTGMKLAVATVSIAAIATGIGLYYREQRKPKVPPIAPPLPPPTQP